MTLKKLKTNLLLVTIVGMGVFSGHSMANHHLEAGKPGKGSMMVEKLQLDAEQAKLYQRMHDAKHRDDRRARRDLNIELRQLAEDEVFDSEKATMLAEAAGRELSQKTYQQALAMHSFIQSLTPEQRANFDAMHEEKKGRSTNK